MNTIIQFDQEEILVIQRAYRNLLRCLKKDISKEDRESIRKAYEIAVQAHAIQRRKSGEPYITHPIEVARICAEEIGLGPTAIAAALLHDVVEDTEVTLDEIKVTFGEKIASIVDGLTKLDHSYHSESAQAENFKKVLSTLSNDVRVVLIKMADRLHNMRTLSSMKREKQLQIASETSYIYAPLAHRLGLYKLKTEFQDLCMKVKEPEFYQEIASNLHFTKRNRNEYINSFIKYLNPKLEEIDIKFRIIGRPKSISSIAEKIRTKNVAFEEIYDLFAIRIIIDVPREKEKIICWQVYSIITDVYKSIPERLKDWVTSPKSNGYESLHTTVIGPSGRYVEVQIRSERMDEIAEKGFAAHWKYKGLNQSSQDVYANWLDSLRALIEDKEKDAIEFVSDFKANLYGEEIYVYTPKGDMFTLPKGATALDFAYAIHTDVGSSAISIKVNNRQVPMGYVLESSDQVQVFTNKTQKPSEGWLKLVITSKAKSKIRQALKEEGKKHASFGKEILERKLNNNKLDFEVNVEFLVKYFRFKSRIELYTALAEDKLKLDLKYFNIEGNRLVQKIVAKTPSIVKKKDNTEITSSEKSVLFINDEVADQFEFQFAKCCNPVKGDDVFAYTSTQNLIKIHRITCPNAEHILANYQYRVLKAEWTVNTNSLFVAEIIISGSDSGPGIIQSISSNIYNMGLDIRSFHIDGNEGYFEGKIKIVVSNLDQLNYTLVEIKKLPYISTAYRNNNI